MFCQHAVLLRFAAGLGPGRAENAGSVPQGADDIVAFALNYDTVAALGFSIAEKDARQRKRRGHFRPDSILVVPLFNGSDGQISF